MFNVSGGELLIILFVALVVLGPQKLPEAARQVGKMVGEFRRLSAGFQREMKAAMDDPLSKVTGEPTPTSISDVSNFTPLPAVKDAEPKESPPQTVGATDHDKTPNNGAAADADDSTDDSAEVPAEPVQADVTPTGTDDSDDSGTPDVPMYGDR